MADARDHADRGKITSFFNSPRPRANSAPPPAPAAPQAAPQLHAPPLDEMEVIETGSIHGDATEIPGMDIYGAEAEDSDPEAMTSPNIQIENKVRFPQIST